jgi:type I restriction enzyme S subunit
MKKEQIGNILQMQRGYDLPVSQMKEGDIPVVGSNGIVGYHNQARCIQPTITIGRSGSAGKVHYYNEPTWVHNTALYLTDFKGNNPKYLYYLLQLLHLENLCGSSVIPSLNRNTVYPMMVNFHELRAEQDVIASVLSSIDDKINLNRAINRNLSLAA